MTQFTTFTILDFVVYTVWACLKAVTQSKTLKEKSSNKNYCNDNYNCYSDTIYFQLRSQLFNFLTYMSFKSINALTKESSLTS